MDLDKINNLLINQQTNQDPQSSGQETTTNGNNNTNLVQKWLEDNWATGS